MSKILKRTWAEIDLEMIRHNYKLVREKIDPSVKIMCIVKADAYGHGVQNVALEHQRIGADWFGVSNLHEALQLRNYGITRPILILGYTPPDRAAELSAFGISQAVFSEEYAQELSKYAQKNGSPVKCHIKLDTGMSRLGFECHNMEQNDRSVEVVSSICSLPNLDCDGIFTHFSVADEDSNGREFTYIQFNNFRYVIDRLAEKGITFRFRHCCNSAASLEYPEFHMDMVRPGIVLYGLAPSKHFLGKYDLKPAMQLKSVISMIKTVEKGATVSYGRTFTAEREMKIATVPIGYADGYPRPLSGKQDMIVNGVRAPIIGRICMDQLMLDVTDIDNVRAGMTVTVFGEEEGTSVYVDELSEKTDTINYETVCLIGKRVPRIYLRGGKQVAQVNYIISEERYL